MDNSKAVASPTAMDKQIKDLQSQIETAKGHQMLLKAHLASLKATSTPDDIRANITALELEKEELTTRLEDFRSGRIKPILPEERELVDQTFRDWTKKAETRKQIFLEMWAIVGDVMPEGVTKKSLWVELGLESDVVGGNQDIEVE
ncbi:MAG: hypothetical protein Q9209_005338 [Squamulea sp. 1 TL-2023]